MKQNFVVHSNYTTLSQEIKSALLDFESNTNYVVKGERNVIKKVTIGDTTFNIKKFKTPNVFQSLVYRFIRKSKACRSFEYATTLIKKDIKTPFPVAYLEEFSLGIKESFYVSEHVEYDFDFRILNHNPKFPDRTKILEQFAVFTFKLHENDINFLDHSPGNTLIVKNGKSNYDFYLIDLNRMRFETLNFEKRMNNFRRLWLSKTMIRIVSVTYADLYNKTFEETHALMSKHSRAFQKKINSKKLRRRKRSV